VLCWLEDFGLCEVGESGAFVADGTRVSLGGDVPVNTAGGQLSGGRLADLPRRSVWTMWMPLLRVDAINTSYVSCMAGLVVPQSS
jgi:hypothetical protein